MTSYKLLHSLASIATPPHFNGQHDEASLVGFESLVSKQAGLSRDQLCALHQRWLGSQGLFVTFSSEVERLGRQAPALREVDGLKPVERLQRAESAVAFALAQSSRRGAAVNPFHGYGRVALCCIVFDESGTYTLVERYAAYEAMRQVDSTFFINLIATTRGVVERRIVFRGLLEHFDRLLPIEKCIYPECYREAQQAHLEREEVLYGRLTLEEDIIELLDKVSPVELLRQVQYTTEAVF